MDWKQFGLSAKDLIYVIPLAGSVIAVVWEIGSFFPIGQGAFGFFSLSEHLLFALEALPAGVSVIIGVTVVIAISTVRPTLQTPALLSLSSLQRRLLLIGAFLVSAGIGGFISWFGYTQRDAFIFICGLFVIVISFAFFLPAILSDPKIFGPTLLVFVVLATMATAMNQTRGMLNFSDLADINIDGSARKVVCVRSGERGILIYERASMTFLFVKWNAVKGVSWPRRAMLPFFNGAQ
jgi:hypothetical protein